MAFAPSSWRWPPSRKRCWQWTGVPEQLTVLVDSTVSVRYGLQQDGAEKGYNPHKPGRPSHHPVVAFLQETGDLAGLKWRPGSAHTATGTKEWISELVERLRSVDVQKDHGFVEVRKRGSSKQFRHPDGRVKTVPFHEGRDISPSLLRRICKELDGVRRRV